VSRVSQQIDWIVGAQGDSCDEACLQYGECAESELKLINSEGDIQVLEGMTGTNCHQALKWSFPHSPSICTGSGCCRPWGCNPWCSYGLLNAERSCSAKPSTDYQRFCPCLRN